MAVNFNACSNAVSALFVFIVGVRIHWFDAGDRLQSIDVFLWLREKWFWCIHQFHRLAGRISRFQFQRQGEEISRCIGLGTHKKEHLRESPFSQAFDLSDQMKTQGL
jgi:hypothetical protein